MNLTAEASDAHRRLLSGGPRARIMADELAARGIDADDIARWTLGAGMAPNRRQGVYRGEHLAVSWPTFNTSGGKVMALTWRRALGCDDVAAAPPAGWRPPPKYAYSPGSRPGEALFGAHLLPADPPFVVWPEGYPCVVAPTEGRHPRSLGDRRRHHPTAGQPRR